MALDREELRHFLKYSILPISLWSLVQNGQDTHQCEGPRLSIQIG